jgi:hypothetical protein
MTRPTADKVRKARKLETGVMQSLHQRYNTSAPSSRAFTAHSLVNKDFSTLQFTSIHENPIHYGPLSQIRSFAHPLRPPFGANPHNRALSVFPPLSRIPLQTPMAMANQRCVTDLDYVCPVRHPLFPVSPSLLTRAGGYSSQPNFS